MKEAKIFLALSYQSVLTVYSKFHFLIVLSFVLIQNERTKEKIKTAFPPFAKGKFYFCKNCYSSGDKLTCSFLPLSFNAIFTANKTGVHEVVPFRPIYKRNVKLRLKRLAEKGCLREQGIERNAV